VQTGSWLSNSFKYKILVSYHLQINFNFSPIDLEINHTKYPISFEIFCFLNIVATRYTYLVIEVMSCHIELPKSHHLWVSPSLRMYMKMTKMLLILTNLCYGPTHTIGTIPIIFSAFWYPFLVCLFEKIKMCPPFRFEISPSPQVLILNNLKTF